MPIILLSEIRHTAELREPGLEATVKASGRLLGTESVLIEHDVLMACLAAHPRLKVQPVTNKIWVPGGVPGPMPLGDRVEQLAKPIAKALNMSCIDEQGNLKKDSNCANHKGMLNAVDAEVRRTWHKLKAKFGAGGP